MYILGIATMLFSTKLVYPLELSNLWIGTHIIVNPLALVESYRSSNGLLDSPATICPSNYGAATTFPQSFMGGWYYFVSLSPETSAVLCCPR